MYTETQIHMYTDRLFFKLPGAAGESRRMAAPPSRCRGTRRPSREAPPTSHLGTNIHRILVYGISCSECNVNCLVVLCVRMREMVAAVVRRGVGC